MFILSVHMIGGSMAEAADSSYAATFDTREAAEGVEETLYESLDESLYFVTITEVAAHNPAADDVLAGFRS